MNIINYIVRLFRPKNPTVNTPPKLLESGDKSNWKNRYDFKIGDFDHSGHEIVDIHHRLPGKYLIYEIADSRLRFVVEDTTIVSNSPDFNLLWLKIADYVANEPTLKKTYISYLSFAVKALHDENPIVASQVLTSAHDSILRRLKRRTVLPYLAGAFSLVLISLFVYFAIYLINHFDSVSTNFKLNEFGYMIFNAVTLSSIGGFLSVANSLRNINVDVQDNPWTNAVHGFIRIVIAMISGVIMYFLIQGDIALTFIKNSQNLNAYYVAFFVSGFSEKLVSDMLFDFEKKRDSTKTVLEKS